ncbi:MAG: GTPase [Campylobacter sp.]
MTNLYLDIQITLDDLENILKSNTGKVGLATYNIIKEFRSKKLDIAMKILQENQEWERFSIGFYGETNSGKSTIIESLRIRFNEKTKTQAKQKIMSAKIRQSDLNRKIDESIKIEKSIDLKIKNLETKEKLANIFVKFWRWINGSKNKKLIAQEKDKLSQIQSKLKLLNDDLQTTKNIIAMTFDGVIIGDGRPDFTRKMTKYEINNDEIEFDILDIPGIEGDEKTVEDEIVKAIKKSHAIFYVTSKPSTPEEKTIHKIKKHLNDQTEVYSIYNFRATNPKTLNQNIENNEGIQTLINKMKEVLKEQYIDNITICALGAFFALSDNPDPKFQGKSEKFLAEFSKENLLSKTKFDEFEYFLIFELIQDAKFKIKRANFNKANVVLIEFIDLLNGNILKIYDDTYNKIKNKINTTNKILENSIETSKQETQSIKTNVLDTFTQETRKSLYNKIDSNISNKDLEGYIKREVEYNFNILKKSMEIKTKKVLDEFKDTIKKDIQQLSDDIEQTLDKLSSVKVGDDIGEINIKSGIDKLGLFGSAVGAGTLLFGAVNIYNPVGWITLAGVVVGFIKSLMGWFNSNYKKEQQRNFVDKNLKHIRSNIEENINNLLREIFNNFSKEKDKQITNLELELENIQKVKENLIDISDDLKNLSDQIKQQGETK